MSSTLQIRPMTRSELDLAVDWALGEGWNPGLDDVGAFHAADPGGFLLGSLDGRPVCCISVVRYGEDFGFLGFYICAEALRGQGHGWAIWQAGMARLAGRTVGLDGVVDQQANYRKSGFLLAHRNIRHGGAVALARPEDPRLRSPDAGLIEALLAYDRPFYPAPRETFLRAWLDPERRVVRALVEEGRVVGYGVLRTCHEGAKIGPLFAESEAGADLLFRALAAEASPGPLFLDTPEPNAAAIKLAERYRLSPVFETARMYAGSDPELPLERIFGITTFELG
jgi:hypothetical protein